MQIIDHQPHYPNYAQLKRGLLIALPLVLIVNGVIWGLYAMNMQTLRLQWQSQASMAMDGIFLTIDRLRNDLYGDLRLLADSPNLQQVLDETDERRLLALASQWEVFSGVKRRYDQIRWIDESGMERLRVDLTSTGAKRLSDDQLQDKSQRYYVREAQTFQPGKIYASPIDLNLEHGEIERPYKPMLRLVMTLANSQGMRRGLLVLNVKADAILDDLARHARLNQGRLLLIDHRGSYLRGFSEDQAWGNMQIQGDDAYRHFDRTYPALWTQMLRTDAGHVTDAAGLFIYRTIKYGKGEFENRYFLVMALLSQELAALSVEERKSWLTVSLLVSVMLTLMAFYIAYVDPRQGIG